MNRLSTPVLRVLACLSLFAAIAQADIIYNVGPGQTYATIQAAINAIPGSVTFTEPRIINVHAGTYGAFETYQGGAANNKLPTADHRLIIQAVPGHEVIVNQGGSLIRTNYVTVQGLKFQAATPLGTSSYYLNLNFYSEGKGGAIIQNNEFVNGAPFQIRTVNTEAPEFSYAFVHNAAYGFNANNAVYAGIADNKGQLVGGNLFYNIGLTTGENMVLMQVPSGSDAKYVLNNTFVSNVNDTQTDIMVRTTASPNLSPLTIANNVIVTTDSTPGDRGYQFESGGVAFTAMANLFNNLQYDSGFVTHMWANLTDNGGSQNYSSLAAFNAALIAKGLATEQNSIDNTDPLFKNLLGNDFRPQGTSPLQWGGDPNIWATAIADLGIADQLASYWNPLRDYLYDRTGTYIGALIPEPTSLALLALAGLAGLRRPHAPGAARALPGSPA